MTIFEIRILESKPSTLSLEIVTWGAVPQVFPIYRRTMNTLEKLQKELAKEGYILKWASELNKDDKIKTGIFGLDYVLDGGISTSEGGHRIEFFGAESCGKTTFALYVIKKFQELGKTCAFVDAERSYDKDWGEKIGIDNEKLLILYPDTLEQLGDLLVKVIPQVDLLVVDSIVSMIPMGEADRDTEQPQVALASRVNSLITRKIYHASAGKTCTLIFINQLREKVGVMYGNPNTTGGGHALKHMYNTRIEFKLGKPIEEKQERIGQEIKLNCVKNKRGKAYRKTEIDFYINSNLDNQKSLFYAGIKLGAVQRSGNTYEIGDCKAVGQEKFLESMTPEAWKLLETKIWEIMK